MNDLTRPRIYPCKAVKIKLKVHSHFEMSTFQHFFLVFWQCHGHNPHTADKMTKILSNQTKTK